MELKANGENSLHLVETESTLFYKKDGQGFNLYNAEIRTRR